MNAKQALRAERREHAAKAKFHLEKVGALDKALAALNGGKARKGREAPEVRVPRALKALNRPEGLGRTALAQALGIEEGGALQGTVKVMRERGYLERTTRRGAPLVLTPTGKEAANRLP